MAALPPGLEQFIRLPVGQTPIPGELPCCQHDILAFKPLKSLNACFLHAPYYEKAALVLLCAAHTTWNVTAVPPLHSFSLSILFSI